MTHHAQGEDFPGPTPHAVQRQMRHAVAFRGYQGQCGGDQPRHQPGGREPRPGPGAGHALVALAGGDRYWARQRAHQGGRSQTLSHQQGGHQVRQRTQRGRMHRAGCRQRLYPGFDQRVQFRCRGHEHPPSLRASTTLSFPLLVPSCLPIPAHSYGRSPLSPATPIPAPSAPDPDRAGSQITRPHPAPSPRRQVAELFEHRWLNYLTRDTRRSVQRGARTIGACNRIPDYRPWLS